MKNILCLIFFINVFILSAQQDSIQIDTFSVNKLLIRAFTGTKSYHFIFKQNVLGVGEQIEYKSIEKAFLGFAAHYNGLGGHVWIGLPLYLGKAIPYEQNKAIDIQANFYKKHFVFDVNYQNFQGLHLRNAQNFQLPIDEKGEFFRKDLDLSSLNANYIYEFNKKFSLSSGFTQTIRQTQSIGTPLFMSCFEWDNFHADSNLIPHGSKIYKQLNQQNLTYGNFIAGAIGGGYGYNLIYKKRYFFSLLGTVGPSLQWQKLNIEDGQLVMNYHYNLRFGFGYNGDKWISGITFVRDYQNYHFSKVQVHLARQHIKIFVGYRFHSSLDEQIKQWLHF